MRFWEYIFAKQVSDAGAAPCKDGDVVWFLCLKIQSILCLDFTLINYDGLVHYWIKIIILHYHYSSKWVMNNAISIIMQEKVMHYH